MARATPSHSSPSDAAKTVTVQSGQGSRSVSSAVSNEGAGSSGIRSVMTERMPEEPAPSLETAEETLREPWPDWTVTVFAASEGEEWLGVARAIVSPDPHNLGVDLAVLRAHR